MQPLDTLLVAPGQAGALLGDPQTTVTVVGVVAVVLLVALSAFFASAEIAIFSLPDHRIGALVEEGTSGAATLDVLKSDPRRLLVTILVGNNVANIGMSSIATGLLGFYLAPGEAVLVATFGVTSLVLLFGETAPKSYAVEHSESWALRVARPLRGVQVLLYPFVAVFDTLTRGVNALMGSEGNFERAYVTRAEVQSVITAGQRAGVFTEDEHVMLQRLLRFRNRSVKETMVPRLDVVAVDADATVEAALDTCREGRFTRLPVYEGVLDNVVGTVHVLDLVAARHTDEATRVGDLAEEAHVVPESKDVDELLRELRAERRRMAIVVDEFGATAGIVTIEDIVEEIVGEVLTETEAPPIRWLDDDTAVVRGETNIHDANDALGTDLPELGGYETIAGLLFEEAGRVLEEGEGVTEDGVDLFVETAEGNRILEVRVTLPDGDAATGTGRTETVGENDEPGADDEEKADDEGQAEDLPEGPN